MSTYIVYDVATGKGDVWSYDQHYKTKKPTVICRAKGAKAEFLLALVVCSEYKPHFISQDEFDEKIKQGWDEFALANQEEPIKATQEVVWERALDNVGSS